MPVILVALHADPAHGELASRADDLAAPTSLIDHNSTVWARLGRHDHVEVV